MADKAILHLGAKGVVTDPNEILRLAYIHAFEANHSQSVMHKDKVMSVQWIAASYASEPSLFCDELTKEFRAYYERWFPGNVEVKIWEKNPGEKVKYHVNISITVTHQGKSYTLENALFRDNTSDITTFNKALV